MPDSRSNNNNSSTNNNNSQEVSMGDNFFNTNDAELQAQMHDDTGAGSYAEEVAQEISSQIPDLEELCKTFTLKDELHFKLNTLNGVKTVTVMFDRWADTGKIRAIIAGTPASWSQPVINHYDVVGAIRAVAGANKWRLIDPSGLLLAVPFEVYEIMDRGSDLGWVSTNYAKKGGEYDMPVFGPREKLGETYKTGWAELVKNDGERELGFIAVKNGKYYRKMRDWQHAAVAYDKCAYTMALVGAEGGLRISVSWKLQDYANYFHMLWNLEQVQPAIAEQIRKGHYKKSLQMKAVKVAARKEYGEMRREQSKGIAREPITQIGSTRLIEGIHYQTFNAAGVRMEGFRFSLTDDRLQSKLAIYKERVENKGYTIAAKESF